MLFAAAPVLSLSGVSRYVDVRDSEEGRESLQNRGHLEGFQKLLFLAALSSVTPSDLACSSHQKRDSVLFTCETTSNRSLVRSGSRLLQTGTLRGAIVLNMHTGSPCCSKIQGKYCAGM